MLLHGNVFPSRCLGDVGRIDKNKELVQLVTNLTFSLKLNAVLTPLLEHAERVGENVNWDVEQFVAWFLPKLQQEGI